MYGWKHRSQLAMLTFKPKKDKTSRTAWCYYEKAQWIPYFEPNHGRTKTLGSTK